MNCEWDFKKAVFSYPYPSDSVTLIIFVLLWFVFQEIFVQQAKYIWNDIRDRNSNQTIPLNRQRPVEQSSINTLTYLEMFTRWMLGFIFAFMLSKKLFTIVLIFSLLQVIYEFWGKPNSKKIPVAPLFISSIGTMIRFISGAYAVGWELSDSKLWFYALIFLSLGTILLATMWKIEAVYLGNKKEELPRGQSSYFIRTGHQWIVASWVYLYVLLIIIFLYRYTSPIQTGFLSISQMPLYLGTGLLVMLAVLLYAFSFRITAAFIKIYYLIKGRRARKFYIALFVLFGVVTAFGVLFANWQSHKYVIAFCILVSLFYIQFWSIGYEEFSFMHFTKNFSLFKKAIGLHVFSANSDINLWHIPAMLQNINSPEFENKVNSYFKKTQKYD